jgi:hypothetical protein
MRMNQNLFIITSDIILYILTLNILLINYYFVVSN